MKLLLTGSSGFIGEYFKNKYSNKYNIQTFSFLKDDFKSLSVERIDVVIHLSAIVHQMDGASSKEYERVNIAQTLDLAKKAKASAAKHFVFMSTIAVYGVETGIISENTNCSPINDYGKSKLKAEQELQKLEDDNFIVSIIRPPIVNGYKAPGNMKSLINLVQKVPVLPFGNIQNKRSMIYVGNLCFFMDAIIEKRMSGVFLVADERAVSTTELIELIAQALGKKVYLVRVPFFEGFLKLVKPSFHKRLFGSLEVDNHDTLTRLFGEAKASLPCSVEEGIGVMLNFE